MFGKPESRGHSLFETFYAPDCIETSIRDHWNQGSGIVGFRDLIINLSNVKGWAGVGGWVGVAIDSSL